MEVNPVVNDYNIPDYIDDTISQIKFYPGNANNVFLGAGGWDGKLRIWNVKYEINPNVAGGAIFQTGLLYNSQLTDPILSIAWKPETMGIFTGNRLKHKLINIKDVVMAQSFIQISIPIK